MVAIYIGNSAPLAGAHDFVIEYNTDVDENRKIIQASYTTTDDAGTVLQPFDDAAESWHFSGIFILSPDGTLGPA